MMDFLYITYEAIERFISTHHYQSSDYDQAIMLCGLLRRNVTEWSDPYIKFYRTKRGGYLYIKNISDSQGIIFDYKTFNGFNEKSENDTILIFQKTLRFAKHYFDGLPYTNNERFSMDRSIGIVFPYQFVARKEVDKVLIDMNPGNISRSGKKILQIYEFADKETGVKPDTANFNKALEEIKAFSIEKIDNVEKPITDLSLPLKIVELEEKDLSIDSNIGLAQWEHFLTKTQKIFVESDITGPERLEGAAGTGKTLVMVLRCIKVLENKVKNDEDYHIAFFTHTRATRDHIEQIFMANWEEYVKYATRENSKQSITITTLNEWCIDYLGFNIGVSEYMDRDAFESKNYQIYCIEDAYSKAMKEDFNTFKSSLSATFLDFLTNTDKSLIIEMLRHEIAVTIKGRAHSDLERYKKLNRLEFAIPCKTDADLSFVFLIYRYYDNTFSQSSMYDTDDIILSATGQLKTPIWRRRRVNDGYNALFIDEAHMFNLNELSVFHYLIKEEAERKIIFAIDKTQAVGDRGLNDLSLSEVFKLSAEQLANSHKLNTVFRNSPDIISVAFSILSSGAALFVSFDNPLKDMRNSFTEREELLCEEPSYDLLKDDNEMIREAMNMAECIHREKKIPRSKIMIVSTDDNLFNDLKGYVAFNNKPVEILDSRGNIKAIKNAESKKHYVLSMIDYIGGLEFDSIIIVGVDKGRVPAEDKNNESYLFSKYTWHNKMYVAVTRARYILKMLGVKTRGASELMHSVIKDKSVKINFIAT